MVQQIHQNFLEAAVGLHINPCSISPVDKYMHKGTWGAIGYSREIKVSFIAMLLLFQITI